MKILKYFFLVVFVLIYCAGILLDMTVTLYGGLGGPYQYLWIIPLHFILSTVFFAVYLVSLRPGVLNANIKSLLSGILFILVSPAPYFFLVNNQ
jgi:hypothetical protein